MKIILVVDWSPQSLIIQTCFLVCDRANTCSLSLSGKVVKLQPGLLQCLVIKWIYNIVLFGGKNAGCSFFITFNWCICLLFLTLVSDGRLQWPRLRNSDPFTKSDVNLFNHLVRKADVAGCCSAGSVLRWHEVAVSVFSVADLYCLKLFFTLSWCRSINTDTCVIIDYLTWLYVASTHAVICRW